MKTSDYRSLPSKSGWKRDSSLLVGRRDNVLANIDKLLGNCESASDGSEKINYFFHLYFALDYWLGHYDGDPAMDAKRKPAIQALYKFIAFELCKCMDCSINTLPTVLENYFGREMTAHGERIDSVGRAMTPTRARIERFRLHWDSEKEAFMQLQQDGADFKMLPAQSHELRNLDVTKDGLKANFANFVMTMGGDLYMAPHTEVTKKGWQQSWFHSSYRGGQAVMCAGSIFVDDGRVCGVQNNSGHYKPTDDHMYSIIRHLQMLGHPIENVEVWNFTGKVSVKGGELLNSSGNWEAAVRRSRSAFSNWQGRTEAQGEKADTIRKFMAGVPLRQLVESRMRAQQGREFHQVWDEIVLEVMGADRSYVKHLGVLIGTPEKMGADAPILSRPARPTSKPPKISNKPPLPTTRPWK